MNSKRTTRIVMASLFAAMVCVSTMIFRIPSPLGGYIHLGDGFVLLSGILFGPLFGGAAAGIGSMLADILSGYPQYAIGTFVIKALAAIIAYFVYSKLTKSSLIKSKVVSAAIAGICGGILVTGGYFVFEATLLGYGLGALANTPANLVQNVAGIVISCLLLPILLKINFIRDIMHK